MVLGRKSADQIRNHEGVELFDRLPTEDQEQILAGIFNIARLGENLLHEIVIEFRHLHLLPAVDARANALQIDPAVFGRLHHPDAFPRLHQPDVARGGRLVHIVQPRNNLLVGKLGQL